MIVKTTLDDLAKAFPDATVSLKELSKIMCDSEVALDLNVTCTHPGYEATWLEPAEAPEFEYECTDMTIEDENISVTGVEVGTLVYDLDLMSEVNQMAYEQDLHKPEEDY